MPELHARLLADVIALGSPYPLVLTDGYAVRAHRLVNPLSRSGSAPASSSSRIIAPSPCEQNTALHNGVLP